MTDDRIDALIRHLDVADSVPPGFVEDTYPAIRDEALAAGRRDRTLAGRLQALVSMRVPAQVPDVQRGRVTLVLAVGLLMLLLWAVLVGVGSITGPPPWAAHHVLFGRAHPAGGLEGYDLYVTGVDGSGEHLLLAGARDISRVSHDGTRIAIATIGSLVFPTLVRPDGTQPVELHPDPTLNLGAMAWSRDGAWLAFEAWDDTDHGRDGVWLLRRDGTGLRRLTGAGIPGDFSLDGRQVLVTRQEGIFVVDIDGSGERQVGPLKPVAYSAAGFMPDGSSAYAAAGGKLWIIDLAKGAARSLEIPGGQVVTPRLSPDGRTFVLTFDATAATNTAIWLMNADGSGAHELADDPNLNEDFSDWLP